MKNQNALTSGIVNVTMTSLEPVEDQQDAILNLQQLLQDLVHAEKLLTSIHGDNCLGNALLAADLVDSSRLRFTLPKVWAQVSAGVYGALLATYERAPDSRMSDDLYIMRSDATGAVKIGRTRIGAKARAQQLKTSCPDIQVVKVFEGCGDLERTVHKELRHLCVGGEWFGVTSERAIAMVTPIVSAIKKVFPAALA